MYVKYLPDGIHGHFYGGYCHK